MPRPGEMCWIALYSRSHYAASTCPCLTPFLDGGIQAGQGVVTFFLTEFVIDGWTCIYAGFVDLTFQLRGVKITAQSA